jgi:hypothetical protein
MIARKGSRQHMNEDTTYSPFSRFNLTRSTDITGISGTGKVAVGVQWPDKTIHLYWLKTATTGHYKNITQLESIHCYNDASGKPNARVEWIDQKGGK